MLPDKLIQAADLLDQAACGGHRLFLFDFGRGQRVVSWGLDRLHALKRLGRADACYIWVELTELIGNALENPPDTYLGEEYVLADRDAAAYAAAVLGRLGSAGDRDDGADSPRGPEYGPPGVGHSY